MPIGRGKIKKACIELFQNASYLFANNDNLSNQKSFCFHQLVHFHCKCSLGSTPLHWAALRGNLESCTVLIQAGKKEDLTVQDNTGLTPVQLAADKNHRQVAFFLVSIIFYCV